MFTKDIKALLSRLNSHVTVHLEAAATLAVARSHYDVFPDHLFLKLLEEGSGDIPLVLHHFEIEQDKVWEALSRGLDRFGDGNTGQPKFSRDLLELFEQAWIVSSLHLDQSLIRSGAMLESYLEDHSFASTPFGEAIAKIDTKLLRTEFSAITSNSAENARDALARPDSISQLTSRKEGQTALDLYTIDVTARARDGEIDPVYGRDNEIRQIIDVLSRRRKNNPMLVGDAGVGKTAVVEGLALRIVDGDVIETLKDVEIRGLDMGLLQAGAGVKGEFENRLKSVVNQIVENPNKIVLFIDEAHTLIGAGGPAGAGDAANLLKPALARGRLRTIGATTWSEYKKYIEKDPALERRFQMVKIEEPDEETACIMLRGIKKLYERHHGLNITDDAIQSAVRLSNRYIAARQLPDKAVDLLDTAAARVRMFSSGKPDRIELLERRRTYVERRIAALEEDLARGYDIDQRTLKTARDDLKGIDSRMADYDKRWQKQRAIADKIIKVQQTMGDQHDSGKSKVKPTKKKLGDLRNQLRLLQGEEPLVMTDVDSTVVGSVVSDWTGIPVGRMVKDQASTLLNMEEVVAGKIIGQDHALSIIADTVRINKSGMSKPDMPIGVFLLVGPSGVGKTETARLTAETLFGGEKMMTVINMSEYQEKHTVSQLKGSPPGYIGYGEGGVLTEAVRRRPYSLVLLDEVEKADREVLNLFYQVFDKGFMRDGEGREIDFKNTVIMMTSNLGSDIIMDACNGGEGNRPDPETLTELIRPDLIQHFQAALLARTNVIPFYPLEKDALRQILKLKLDALGARLEKAHGISLDYDETLLEVVLERCVDPSSGARNIDFVIDRQILPDASRALVNKLADETMLTRLRLYAAKDGQVQFDLS